MRTPALNQLFPDVDPAEMSLIPVLDHFHEGVIITDATGIILYINSLQEEIDDLKLRDIRGKNISDVYRVDEGQSPVTQCIQTGTRIENLACFYRTRMGKVVNSLHNVTPLYARDRLVGILCFIRAYSLLEQELAAFSEPANINYMRKTDRSHSKSREKRLKNGTRFTFDDIIGQAPNFKSAIEASRLASDSPSTVMLFGETGAGKELIAQSIHNRSQRSDNPYVALNCAAIPENLLEGILFGTTKGAFTGATDKPGLFEKASGGTLFLDEINSMSMGLQAKLLRVLQERRIRRVGALHEIPLDLKIISSVNEDPHEAVKRDRLRADLLYRLGVVFIRIPPLRERREDLPDLVTHFIRKYNAIMEKQVRRVSGNVMALFTAYAWQGNVRELEHVIEGAMNLVRDQRVIRRSHLSVHIGGLPTIGHPHEHASERPPEQVRPSHKLSEAHTPNNHPGEGFAESRRQHEVRVIRDTLGQTSGNVAKAARHLQLSPQLLHYKLKKYGISAVAFKPLMGPSKTSKR
ncbi:MAG: sigma 54-interacting transcriptional regulator [Desulfobacterales bacterium]|nr:sigma 54-interacting transcriptional regulator [Desulfobacterales bacterium]